MVPNPSRLCQRAAPPSFSWTWVVTKGDVFSLPAGTPLTLPVAGKVAWAGKYQEVIDTGNGFLNFLHVNPSLPVGSVVKPGESIGVVTSASGNYTDPTTGHFYTSTGNVAEVGLYDSLNRAIARDNSNPADFTGISNPTPLFQQWDKGQYNNAVPGPSSNSGMDWGQGALLGAETALGSVIPGLGFLINAAPAAGAIGGQIAQTVGNPVADAVVGATRGVELWFMRLALVAGLAIAGFMLIMLAFRKQIASAVQTGGKVAAVAA